MLTDAQVERFWQDGYLVADGAVTGAQLAAMRAEIARWVEASRAHAEPFGPPTIDERPRFDMGAEHSAERPALRIPPDSPFVQAAARALARAFDRPPVLIGMGGSIPAVEAIKRLLGMDSLLVGFGLADDRVHSPNEKFELRCFERGIRTHAALLAEFAAL